MFEDINKKYLGNKTGYFIFLIGGLVVLSLAIFLGLTLYSWVAQSNEATQATMNELAVEVKPMDLEEKPKEEETVQEEIAVEPVPVEDTEKLYTATEVEKMLSEAKEEASVAAREALIADIEMRLEGGATVTKTLRECISDRLVLVSGGKYFFMPIRNDLKKNKYVMENLQQLPSGELQYVEKDKVVSHKGIDVSKFQGKINWTKVAADGVEFAMIRLGYRGYGGAGKLVADESFDTNLKGAMDAGIKTGVYFYTQATNEDELQEEIDMILEKLEPYKLQGPVVFDVEKTDAGNGRMDKITVEERTNLTKLFCEKISKAGYKPMIYHNMEMALILLDMKQLEKYDKWYAYYSPEFYYPYAYDIWQYSDKGKVDGIEGDVDLNIAFELWNEK